MNPSAGRELLRGGAFLAPLPGHLRHPAGPQAAEAALEVRLRDREGDFLAVARRCIYGYARSPYRALLREAGCEYADLAALVRREGLEATLTRPYRHGVYLTVQEIKGRQRVDRLREPCTVSLESLRNPTWWTRSRLPPGWTLRWVPRYRALFVDLSVNAALACYTRGWLSSGGKRDGSGSSVGHL